MTRPAYNFLIVACCLLLLGAAGPAAAQNQINPGAYQGEGVIIFEHDYYQGRSEVLTSDVEDMRYTSVGNDRISSIRVPAGWSITLFEHVGFQGRSVTLTADIADMRLTTLGDDAASSAWVSRTDSGGLSPGGGVTVYRDVDFRGPSEMFNGDNPDLRRSTVGNDRISSVRVPPGWVVILFEHVNYQGRREMLLSDYADLRRGMLGNDVASSLQVRRLEQVRFTR